MVLTELLDLLPGEILIRRIRKDQIYTPKHILFLTAPCRLESDILYILDSASAGGILPGCSAPSGATILSSGAISSDVPYQVNINFVAVGCDLLELHNCAAAYLSKKHLDNNLDIERFRHKFSDIVEGNVSSDFQIDALCSTFPRRLKSSYCVICIQSPSPQDKTYEDQLMRGELEKLFPDDNITSYDGETIVIHSYDGFTHPPRLPMRELSALLKKHDACAGVSNGMRKPARLRRMYILSKKALESGKIISDSEKNIYFYDDTMLYSIVSFATSAFKQQFDTDDIISLGSPMLANIIKHDPNGKRNLVETLIQYLIYGKSTSRTAKAMHVHRNTVQNRIAIIEEIIGVQFAKDGMLQAKLLVTYYIMLHYKNVWHKEIELSPLCEVHENVVNLPNE